MLEFCWKTDTCARRSGHLGTCTATPNPRTVEFDMDRERLARMHVRRSVEGSELKVGRMVAPVMPEYLTRRHGGTL